MTLGQISETKPRTRQPAETREVEVMHKDSDSTPSDVNDTVWLCLLPAVDYSILASLLDELSRGEHYRVCLDVNAVSHFGTVEFRVLSTFATSFRLHGGFVKLENVSAGLAAQVRDFGFTDLLPAPPREQASGGLSTRAPK